MMERRAKERLIGAGILVALAVIVVPELLSGPNQEAAEAARPDAPLELPQTAAAPGAVRNVTVDLNTSKPLVPAPAAASAGPSPPTPTVAAPAPTPIGAPAGDPDASDEAPDGASDAAATAPAPRSAAEAAAAPQRSGAAFAVQLGSFANRRNADNLVHQLKAQGFAVYTLSEGSGNAARYRVRVGPLNDRDAAARTIAKLKLAGHAATLVAPR